MKFHGPQHSIWVSAAQACLMITSRPPPYIKMCIACVCIPGCKLLHGHGRLVQLLGSFTGLPGCILFLSCARSKLNMTCLPQLQGVFWV